MVDNISDLTQFPKNSFIYLGSLSQTILKYFDLNSDGDSMIYKIFRCQDYSQNTLESNSNAGSMIYKIFRCQDYSQNTFELNSDANSDAGSNFIKYSDIRTIFELNSNADSMIYKIFRCQNYS